MSAIKPILIVAAGLTMIVAFILYTVSNALPSWYVSLLLCSDKSRLIRRRNRAQDAVRYA